MAVSDDSPMDVNKQDLYGIARSNLRWRDKLARRATHVALDIPDDEMHDVGNKYGMGWKELTVVGAIVVGSLFAMLFAMRQTGPSEPTPPAPVPAASVPDTEYEVRFYDEDGNRLPIEYRKPK